MAARSSQAGPAPLRSLHGQVPPFRFPQESLLRLGLGRRACLPRQQPGPPGPQPRTIQPARAGAPPRGSSKGGTPVLGQHLLRRDNSFAIGGTRGMAVAKLQLARRRQRKGISAVVVSHDTRLEIGPEDTGNRLPHSVVGRENLAGETATLRLFDDDGEFGCEELGAIAGLGSAILIRANDGGTGDADPWTEKIRCLGPREGSGEEDETEGCEFLDRWQEGRGFWKGTPPPHPGRSRDARVGK